MLLSKINTVIRYSKQSWTNSAFVLKLCPSRNRLFICLDLIYWFVRYGFNFTNYCSFEFWNKSSKERLSYISARRNDALRFQLNSKSAFDIMLNKVEFNKHFSNYIKRGWISTEGNSLNAIIEFINSYDEVIVKPLSDYGGKGIFKISKHSDDMQNKIVYFFDSIKKGNQFIIEQVVSNSFDVMKLAPNSVNTIRIVTLIDNNGTLTIPAALIRMGNGVAITDNFTTGGIACPIDTMTGKMKREAFGINNTKFEAHPYSKIRFEGYYIKGFDKCIELVKDVIKVIPEARYVGWDFIISENGIELLEGNIPPGENITQLAAGKGLWHVIQQYV